MRPLLAAAAAAVVLFCPEALAVAQRTFVSTAGSDANTVANCSLVSPCRSFGSALTVTGTDGEIVVLDSGGYGRVTIDKSVSIIAPSGAYAGISVFAGTNGVDVDGAGIVVALRGLAINGQGGLKGIVFTQGARLYIEQCLISNMGTRGVDLLAGDTYITDTTIRDSTTFGILAQGSISVTIDGTRIERNGTGLSALNGPRLAMTRSVVAGNGGVFSIDINSDDGSSETVVTISESNLSQNTTGAVRARATGAGSIVRLALSRNTISRSGGSGIFMSATTGTLTAVVTDNTIVGNQGNGIATSGAGVSATIATNAISGNSSTGVAQGSSSLLRTRSNNIVQDHTTDISGTLTFVAGD